MSSEEQPNPAEAEPTPAAPVSENPVSENDAPQENVAEDTVQDTPENGSEDDSPTGRRRILIGSQRDPAGYRAKRVRDWIPVEEPPAETAEEPPESAAATTVEQTTVEQTTVEQTTVEQTTVEQTTVEQTTEETASEKKEAEKKRPKRSRKQRPAAAPSDKRFPLPNPRDELSDDLQQQMDAAMGDTSFEVLLSGTEAITSQPQLEPESQLTGRVVTVQREDVFVELGGREQGCLPVKQFETPPEPGSELEVVVQRFNPDDGLYDLTLPDAAVQVDDWADINEGMLVEARITGHNTGGLECQVNALRGFIPVSQVSMYRVEDLAQFVDEKWPCLVTECKPERRNLVLSRRAVLEREKEEARQEFIASLEPGQVHEGVVRKLMDFGAFVDIGGIDGLLHISQLSWGRINHPSEVISEGQKIKVKVEKIDKTTGKMSLGYRDMLQNPWEDAAKKYPPNSVVEGTVSKLMEFGAFVELERGVEGLVHISELSHKRVWRASDVVKEGEKIQVMVLSVDIEAERISLSISRLTEPEPQKKKDDDQPGALPDKEKKHKGPSKPLQGGLGRTSGGSKFGLKW